MSFSPCACIGQVLNTPPASTSCPSPGNCISLCDIVVLPKNGVGPCGLAGSLDVTDPAYPHDLSACEESGSWKMISYTEQLASAQVTTAGLLTWVTGGGQYAGKFATVVLEYCCGELSSYLTVLIGIQNLCDCPTCGDCEDCDPCSGLCLDPEIEMIIGGS